MKPAGAQLQVVGRELAATQPATLSGEVVYLYAFDVAYELVRRPVPALVGHPVQQFVVDPSKRSPRGMFFYRPQMVKLPALEQIGPRGPVRLERQVKLLPLGAISITVRVPFQVEKLSELVQFHDLRFADGSYLYDHVRQLAEQVFQELKSYCLRPVAQLGDEEAYTVFCMRPVSGGDGTGASAEQWFARQRESIAGLLMEESDPSKLSEQEVEESTGRALSYYRNDLVVVDWDAALIVDDSRHWEEVLYIMELANLQLAELEAYDRILDDAVERSYRDLGRRRFSRFAGQKVQRELRELRIDMARLSDELTNITKFFGDWHLARIYQQLSARFHMGEWHQTIDAKLQTLDGLYQLLRADQLNTWMLVLEATIVLLFIIDLVILTLGMG